MPALLLRRAALALVACAAPILAQTPAPSPPVWTRGATCYEVFIRSFQDSDGDGIGDLKGLTSKLDYINDGNPRSTRSLGARCIWLMPVAESPSYHGYDASDYYRVEPDYGTNADFKRMVAAAHKRGIKILVDLVLNHSSNEHPYFQAALRDTASPYRSWYRFASPKPDEKGPWGQEAWHKSPVRDEYYYGIFWSGMPDLNYATPAVRQEANKIARFWLREMGVDGFRLDAVPYLSEDHGTLQGSPVTHEVLRDWQAYVRSIRPTVFTVGEVYDTLGAQLPYYRDQLDSYFAFELADSIIAGVRSGRATGVLAPLIRAQREVPFERWTPFLRNHDQPRTRTELGGSVPRARVAAVILLTLPGMPFLYYGEEIGMIGAKPDERLRTPMQWSSGNAAGFTRGKPWQPLADDSLTTTVEAQDHDASSLLALHRRLIHLRDANPALGHGRLVPLTASHDAVVAYARREGNRTVLVVANLGDTALSGVTFTVADSALPAGNWSMRPLLGGATGRLRIGVDGRVEGAPTLQTLAPTEGYVFELTRSR